MNQTTGGRRHIRLLTVLFSAAVFAVCVWYIIVSFDWARVWSVLRDVKLGWLLVGGSAGILLYWVVRACRWYVLLRRLGVEVNAVDVYLCTAVSLSLSLFTPLQSGEALKVELLRKHSGVRRFDGYSSFAVERVADFLVVGLIAFVSLLYKLSILADRRYAYIGIAALALCVAGGAALLRLRPGGRAGEFLGCIRECGADPGTLATVLALTVAGWILVGLSWQVLLYSVSIDLGFGNTMALTSVMTLVNILSLIPGALGVAEAGTAELLIRFGYHAALAQSGAVILRSYGVIAAVLGVLHLAAWTALCRARQSGLAVSP